MTPITKTAKWKYDKMPDGRVFLISPLGDDYAVIQGKSLQDRLDRAALLVKKLNKTIMLSQ